MTRIVKAYSNSDFYLVSWVDNRSNEAVSKIYHDYERANGLAIQCKGQGVALYHCEWTYDGKCNMTLMDT